MMRTILFLRDDDDVHFVLDQHALKQQPNHIIS